MTSPYHSRADLKMRPPRSPAPSIVSEGVTAHYAGGSPWGRADRSSPAAFVASTDHGRCPSIWRGFQAFHMDARGWADIAYSSGVCPHGHRLEGRGPGRRSAAQGTNAGNDRSEAVVYIAGDGDPLTVEAMAAFLDEGARLAGGRLRWQHGDWHSTSCAGPAIRAWKAAGWPSPNAPVPDSTGGFLMPLTEADVEQLQADVTNTKAELTRVLGIIEIVADALGDQSVLLNLVADKVGVERPAA